MYDIFFVCNNESQMFKWKDIKQRFPQAQLSHDTSFQEIAKKSLTKFFWVIWDHCNIHSDFDFTYEVTEWDEEYPHIFKNGNYKDGVALVSKKHRLIQREFTYRWLTVKKEIEQVSSTPTMYDIVFISYNESNADENYAKLLERFPNAKRVHGVKGIHEAHKKAALLCTSDMFWVVDADAEIKDSFNFDYYIPYFDFYSKSTVHVWRSQNPVNGLEYGNGGVKLLPRELTANVDVNAVDMTTSISKQFKAIEEVSNINAFNTDPFNTWKSAFRECVKLASKTIQGQNNEETEKRLDIWCSRGQDVNNGRYAISGALAGRDYGYANRTNTDALKLINDFDWLKEKFDASK
jgi:hypothetical protein